MHYTPAALAQITAPADTKHVQPWVDEHGEGKTWGRHIRGTSRATAGIEIVLVGWQDSEGQVERHASVWANDVQLDATALRQVAAQALNAAVELDDLGRSSQ